MNSADQQHLATNQSVGDSIPSAKIESNPNRAPEPSESRSKHAGSDHQASKSLDTVPGVDSLLDRSAASKPLDFGDAAPPPPRIELTQQQQLEQDIRNTPANPEPYIQLAEIYRQTNRFKEARRVAKTGVDNNPQSNELLELYEEIQLELSHAQLSHAKQRLSSTPTPEQRETVRQCELDLANLKVQTCEARYGRDETKIDLLIPWAVGLRQLNRDKAALEILQIAATHPEIRARACLQLGLCQQKMGKPLDALSAYRRAALFRSPPPPQEVKTRALELAGQLALEKQLLDSAIFYLSHLLEIVPDHAEASKFSSQIAEAKAQLEKGSPPE